MKILSENEFTEIFPLFRHSSGLTTELLSVSHLKTFPGEVLIYSVMTLIEEVAFGKMDMRLLDYIKEKSDNGKLIATHQKIADDLGTSREVVSRLLKDFEREEKVILSRNLIQLSKI